MKNSKKEIIYIGKAKALKNRVTQYFGRGNQHTEKVKQMVANVFDFEYIICDSEFEALILECSLIKQNQPKYNILLKDDKGYHYIRITKEKWRKIETAMQLDDKSEFIGPYYSSNVVKETVEEVRKIFKLPDCNRNFDKYSKPCLNFHIGMCDAPCAGKIKFGDYNKTIDSAIDFIKHGDNNKTLQNLTDQMEKAAENLDFEYAAKCRDRINALKKLKERQKVIMCAHKQQDVFAIASLGNTACVSVISFRNNMLSDKNHYFFEGETEKSAIYSEFLKQYYYDNDDIPNRILLDAFPEDADVIQEWLSQKSGRAVSFIEPKAGQPFELMQMCLKNAADNLSQKTLRTGREMSALNELSSLLGLSKVPEYIESYDISNTAGSENVAGMIVFKSGRPFKPAYKKFKIKSFVGQDDFRSMAEVLDRRFTEYEKGEDEYFSVLPDLILLDGGLGQISAVVPILKKHNVDVPLFGMVKDSKHRTRAIADSGGDIAIKSNRKAYTLITQIQDEVHRFAIGYHRNRRSKNMLNSELKDIEGIGDAKIKILLKELKTIKAIKECSVEKLSNIKGISQKNAQSIYNKFHN